LHNGSNIIRLAPGALVKALIGLRPEQWSCECNLFGARSKDRAIDPGRRAKRFEGTLAGVEKAGVTHDLTDLLGRSDNLRVASRGPQDAKDSGVEDGRDLGQPGGDRHLADAQNELAQDVIDASAVAFRLAARGGRADARRSVASVNVV
jgi:hypothetical protein